MFAYFAVFAIYASVRIVINVGTCFFKNESEYDITNNKVIGGNITDKALLKYIGKQKDNDIKIIDKILFNSENKYSVSIIEKNNKKLSQRDLSKFTNLSLGTVNKIVMGLSSDAKTLKL